MSNVDAIVHEHLLELVTHAVRNLRNLMNERQRTPALAIFWPRTSVLSDEGKSINGAIAMDVTVRPEDYTKVLVGGAKKTGAFGLLFVREEDAGVTFTLETVVDVVAWKAEKQRRGDINFLKEPELDPYPEALNVLSG